MSEKTEALLRKKETRELIRHGYRNVLKCSKSPAESKEHRKLKFLLADFCWSNSLEFASEVTFYNGLRGDFVVEDWKLCFEIMNSEKKKDLEKKHYPLPILPLPVNINPLELEKLLVELRDTAGRSYDYYTKKRL